MFSCSPRKQPLGMKESLFATGATGVESAIVDFARELNDMQAAGRQA